MNIEQAIKTAEKKEKFKELSKNAAQLEKSQQYIKASQAWLFAFEFARNHFNKKWCQYRAEFCTKMAVRPFKG